MAESFVQLPPDGTGKQVDTFAVVDPVTGATKQRQAVVVADPNNAQNVSQVDPQGNLSVRLSDAGGLIDLGPQMIVDGDQAASGAEPGVVVHVSPNTPVFLDQSGLNPIAGKAPSGAVTPVRVGADGGIVLSDCAVPNGAPFTLSALNQGITLDTQYYASVVVHFEGTFTATVSWQLSNDPNLSAFIAGGVVTNANAVSVVPSTVTTPNILIFPCTARYLRLYLSGYTSGSVVILPIFRLLPWQNGAAQNLQFIGGTAVVTAGVAGIPSIGGNIAPGSAPTANPVPVGGIDYTGLTRRFETDANGAQIVAGILRPGWQWGSYNVTYGPNIASIIATATAAQSTIAPVLTGGLDQGGLARFAAVDAFGAGALSAMPPQSGGVGMADLLREIGGLLRVIAYYQHSLATAQPVSVADDPETLLNDYLQPRADVGINSLQ